MRRKIVIVLLTLGAIAGFASGARSLAHHRHHGWGRHADFEAHVADVCVGAAERVLAGKGPTTPAR